MLVAAAAPAVACEKPRPAWVASARSSATMPADFTGDFVNGTPVYRLPPITVVARRDAEFAKAQRDAQQAQAARSRGPAPASAPKRKVASASHEPNPVKLCEG
jgi:hypothetical protein